MACFFFLLAAVNVLGVSISHFFLLCRSGVKLSPFKTCHTSNSGGNFSCSILNGFVGGEILWRCKLKLKCFFDERIVFIVKHVLDLGKFPFERNV